MMSLDGPVGELKRRFLSKEAFYYIFPVLLLVALYSVFLPFNGNYIGEWHDILANSMYYTVVEQNYFATWNNLWVGGYPLIASPHSDKYYLLSFPFYLLFQNLTVVNFILLLHILIAYFAFFKFGSLITKNQNALLIFSLFYAFSGVLLGRVYAGHHLLLYGLAWLPLVYYFFFTIVYYEGTNVRNVIGLSIVSAFIYFTGNLYHFILVYLLLLVFFLYLALSGKISRKIVYYLVLSIFLTSLLISIKALPDINVSGSVLRMDEIDPLAGGGSMETDLMSMIFGMRIDSLWSQVESTVMIGIIPLLLLITAFIYGRKDICIPSFFALLFACIWSAGGKTVFSFVHLLPFLNSMRNPGRMLGAILPVILFLALYGAVIIAGKLRKGESFDLSDDQKKMIAIGAILLLVVKFCELPFQEGVPPQAIISVILAAGFIALLYIRQGTTRNILGYFVLVLIINGLLLFQIYPVSGTIVLTQIALAGLLLAGAFLYIRVSQKKPSARESQFFCGILVAGVFLMMFGNLGSGFVTVNAPAMDTSAAPEIIQKIKQMPSVNEPQLWVYETGWHIKHMEYAYADVMNNVHPMSMYTAYILNTHPQITYTIGNVSYFAPDYIIDTQYLENGNQNLPNYTFRVRNISVLKTDPVLPLVFIIRQNELYRLTIEHYSPGNVVATGALQAGDAVVLKSNYYPGWTVNGVPAENAANFVGKRISSPTDRVVFLFDPVDYKIGAVLSAAGILLLTLLYLKRKDVDRLFTSQPITQAGDGKTQKGKHKRSNP